MKSKHAAVGQAFQIMRAGDYASLGCYPIAMIMLDGGVIHPLCARANALQVGRATRDGYEKQWVFCAADINWEDPSMVCDCCGERIESAYAEDEAESNRQET